MKRLIREVLSEHLVGEEVISLALREMGYYALAVKRVYIDPKVVASMWASSDWGIIYANGTAKLYLAEDKDGYKPPRFVYMAYVEYNN